MTVVDELKVTLLKAQHKKETINRVPFKEGSVAATGPSLGVIQTEQLLFLSTTCPTRPCRGGYFTNTLRTVPSLMRTMFRPCCIRAMRLPSMA